MSEGAVSLTDHGLLIDGHDVPVYSGSVHYWRLERAKWPQILDRVLELGFKMVETYIPWSIHEVSPGVFDWGQIDDRKDVEAFMTLCEEKGLWLQVRPGPLINAELTYFGFPEWVILNPAIQARSASGSLHLDSAAGLHPPHQYPAPSYASEVFYTAVEGWFDHICPIIARHLAPTGCVVSCQSDNETTYFFHDQPYATDYSDDSITLYRQFLADQYGLIDALNVAYRSSYPAFAAVEPPRDCGIESAADLPFHLDWVAYKEFQIRWAVARIARILRDRGIVGIPIFHDVAYQETTPHDVARLEADPDIDWVGMNLYCNKEQYRTVAKRARLLSGSTRLPYIPEFGCGLWSHHQRTFTPEEHEFVTLAAFMNGLKAINYYMLVERERWQGSPITRHGDFRPDYAEFFEQFACLLADYQLWEFERPRERLLLQNYDIGRHVAALSTLHYAHVDLLGLPVELGEIHLDLGLQWDPRQEAEIEHPDSWLGRVSRCLSSRALDFDYADTHVDPARLFLFRTVYVTSGDFMDPGDQLNLLRYVQDGGRLVIGPGMPTLNPTLKPVSVLAAFAPTLGRNPVGHGEIVWVETADLVELVREIEPPAEFTPVTGTIQFSTHRRNEQTILYAANPTADALTDTLTFAGARLFRGIWGDSADTSAGEQFVVTIPPYSIRIWDVRPSERSEGARP